MPLLTTVFGKRYDALSPHYICSQRKIICKREDILKMRTCPLNLKMTGVKKLKSGIKTVHDVFWTWELRCDLPEVLHG